MQAAMHHCVTQTFARRVCVCIRPWQRCTCVHVCSVLVNVGVAFDEQCQQGMQQGDAFEFLQHGTAG